MANLTSLLYDQHNLLKKIPPLLESHRNAIDFFSFAVGATEKAKIIFVVVSVHHHRSWSASENPGNVKSVHL